MSWIFGVVVWVDEVVFIKSKGNADDADCADTCGFGGSDPNIFYVIRKFHSFVFSLLIEHEKPVNHIRVHPRHLRNPRSM